MLDKIKNTLYETLHKNTKELQKEDIKTVWSCKTLQNYKAIFAIFDPSEKEPHLFECTYNGDKKEMYIDHWIKEENMCIKLAEE